MFATKITKLCVKIMIHFYSEPTARKWKHYMMAFMVQTEAHIKDLLPLCAVLIFANGFQTSEFKQRF